MTHRGPGSALEVFRSRSHAGLVQGAEQHPELPETLRHLRQDHSMIEHLLGGLQAVVTRAASLAELGRHLEGLAAIMESHFRYEERQLLTVLETLALDADPDIVLGPL